MKHALLVVLLASCGAPSREEPDGGTCDGTIAASCDERCVWRCVAGQWRADSPCQPCWCVGSECGWFAGADGGVP